jgi:hypothetical protein
MLQAMVDGLGHNDVTAYLSMMAIRLVELHRVLKPTGSIYLHCDPTAGHYVKILLDAVFGARQFLNEITWQRAGAHSDAKRWGRVADTILFYAKGKKWSWNTQYASYTEEYVKERYKYVDDATGRLYWRNTMTAAGPGPLDASAGPYSTHPRGPTGDSHNKRSTGWRRRAAFTTAQAANPTSSRFWTRGWAGLHRASGQT